MFKQVVFSKFFDPACRFCFFSAALLTIMFAPRVTANAIELRIVDPLEPIYDSQSAMEAPAGDALKLTAPRNGTVSAQVVIIGENAGAQTAEMGALTSGESELPLEAVQVRYAHKEAGYEQRLREERETGEPHPQYGPNYLNAYYDRLLDSPSSDTDVQPVWMTVNVPADAAPGTYTGELAIGEHSVPVSLNVTSWICPDPFDFSTHVGVISSHEAQAKHYEVEFWSEAHWMLIEQQLRLMGKIGVDELWLHTNADLGQGEAMALLHFTEREDGRIVPDLTVARRYVELFAEHVGEPSYVIMNYWMGPPSGGSMGWTRESIRVFADGEKTYVPRPEQRGGAGRSHGGSLRWIDRPDVESGIEFWSRVMDAVRELVREQGWPEEIIHIGMSDDQRPKFEAIEAWNEIAPGMAWVAWTHGRGDRPLSSFEDDEPLIIDGKIFGNYTHPFIPRPRLRDREGGGSVQPHLQGGWNQGKPLRASGRNILIKYMRPQQWRSYPNGLMIGSRESGHDNHGGSAGFGFLGLDFWDTARGSHHNRFLDGRHSGRLHRQNSPSVIEPGPDGPVSTVRFEMLREGLQETEARVVLERALVRGGLDAALEEEIRELLTEMFHHRWRGFTSGAYATRNVRTSSSILWGMAEYPHWIELTGRLYELAGRVGQ